ncbi:glycosyltransferase family 39 protein [Pseudomonas syringae]|nr:glycosyltransferase family 39 protein [Pseudomonas syringae]
MHELSDPYKMIVKSEALLEKMPVSIVLFAAFIFYTFNAVTAGSPIFASDEYVYFISGKYVDHLPELYGLDPGLQRLSNLLFFHEVKLFVQLFADHFVSLFRLVHSLEYVLAGALLYASAKSVMPKPAALMGLAVFLALPSHIYIYAVMPETELILLSAMIAFVLVKQYPDRPVVAATIVGFLVSIALLIKPHAMASLAALLVLFPVFNLLCFRKVWVRMSVQTVACFLLALYIGVIGLWALMDGTFTFNPAGALGLTFYGKYIDGPAASIGLSTKLYQVMLYFVANFTVVVLFFLPVFVWTASLTMSRLRGHLNIGEGDANTSPRVIILVLFAMLSIAAHLAMTAWFTAGAAILNAGEAQRLHGRYLGPALVAFPFLFFYSLSCLSQAGKKILVALTLVTLAASYWFVSQHFKIYPWDNPLLFSFFNENNWYGWGFKNLGVRVGDGLYVVIFLGFVASLLFRHWQAAISSVVLCSIIAVGCFQSYFWMYVHLHGNREVSQAGRHFAGLMSNVRHGDGILVGHERYGRESYLLFNLASAPKVIDRTEGVDVTPQDVAGYSWLITDGSYNADALALPSVQVGRLKYYALKPSAGIVLHAPTFSQSPANKPFLKPMSSLDVPLANMSGSSLQGFNDVEPWGAWTSKRTAVIELPVQLKGRIRIRLFAWSLEKNLNEGISLQVGGVVKRLPVGATGAEVEIDVDVNAETDRIVIMSAVDKPSGSDRTLGVAIARVSVESL